MCKHHIGKSKICVNITYSIVGKLEYVMSTSFILIAHWYYSLPIDTYSQRRSGKLYFFKDHRNRHNIKDKIHQFSIISLFRVHSTMVHQQHLLPKFDSDQFGILLWKIIKPRDHNETKLSIGKILRKYKPIRHYFVPENSFRAHL